MEENTTEYKWWKMNQSQFNWLVDLSYGKCTKGVRCSIELRNFAMDLLKRYGYDRKYDLGGRLELMGLRSRYQEELRKLNDMDDLPF